MPIKALNAAVKTTRRGWRIAMRAATRNVLSPISETRIIVKEKTRECSELPCSGMSELESWFNEEELEDEPEPREPCSRASGSSLTMAGGLGCGISCGFSG